MFQRFSVALYFGVALLIGTSDAGADSLDQIIKDERRFTLSNNPFAASSAGLTDYNHLMPDVSKGARDERFRGYQALLARLQALSTVGMSQQDLINHGLLVWRLEGIDDDRVYNQHQIPFNTFYSFFLAANRSIQDLPLRKTADFEDYLARLGALPKYFEQNLTNMREGIAAGFTQPKIVVEGVLPTVEAQVYGAAEQSPLLAPLLQRPEFMSEGDYRRIKQRAETLIEEQVIPSYRALASFLRNKYLPAAKASLAAKDWPNGMAYYQSQIKRYVTDANKSADDIHQIGLSEVARIKGEMLALIADSGYQGSFDEFVSFLRTSPQFYAESAEELLKEASYIAKQIDLKMPSMFTKLPRQPYGIEPVPAEIAPNYTTAAYWGSSLSGDKGGTYVVNTYALDQRPLYELMALTLHEAVPGHHHQNALSKELENVPDFRKGLYFSAFGEGWGLYSEKLGVEMGVYRDHYEHFGRLSYEMWRACRLVIDTGIHAKGWSRQQGLDFLAQNTSLSLANVRAEVDRYISWPAQALSYKLGELKIWELRRRAEAELGDKFDLRQFHDAVLANGALPLSMLDDEISRFISRH